MTFGQWLLVLLILFLAIAAITTLIVAFMGGDITQLFSGIQFVSLLPTGSKTVVTGPGGTGTIPIDFLTDPFNCGSTGHVCDFTLGQICAAGICRCPTGQSLCTGIGCVNLDSATFACGTCLNVCTGGSLCCNGVCTPALNNPNSCGACNRVCTGTTPACCSGNCRDLANSNASCGACFAACAVGLQCCGGVCKNLTSDSQHCGGCGNTCPPNTICQNSTCVPGCATGFILCGGVCVDPNRTNNHCGGCNLVCPAGTYCNGGFCFPNQCNNSPTGTVFCPSSGLCQQTLSSQQNCGSCGTVCPLFCIGASCTCQVSADCPPSQSCQSGYCQIPSCPPGTTFCGHVGQCINLLTNNGSCGSCATACFSGFNCVAGQCQCALDSQCPLGQVCQAGLCVFN